MANAAEAPELSQKEMEQLAADRAANRIRTARWDLTGVVLAYATLGAVLILRLEGIAIEFVAIIGIFGLLLVWFIGWKRGKKLFRQFYNEELSQLHEFLSVKKAEATRPSILTPRETEIITLISRGYPNKQIAQELGTSESTVKNHISSIIRKLDVNDRTQAVVMAINNRWIASPDIEPLGSNISDKI